MTYAVIAYLVTVVLWIVWIVATLRRERSIGGA
jgi:hypothetical protein